MTTVIVAIAEPAATRLKTDLEELGIRVSAVCAPLAVNEQSLHGADAVILPASRTVLTPTLVATCDRARVRIVTLSGDDADAPARLGLAPSLAADAHAWQVVQAVSQPVPQGAAERATRSRVVAVWGPPGAPGRTTVAIEMAVALAAHGGRVALIDADTHAPSVALLLGLGTDSPGLAAACRRAAGGVLDAAELSRLAVPVTVREGTTDVLTGLNRPSRWPEISHERLTETLRLCREWAGTTVVDVASALESDEELSFDVHAPRRNAATLATLASADAIIAVASADPLGIARLLQEHAELRRVAVSTPVTVVVNRIRSGAIGFDARGQIRRTLERFAGIDGVRFLPDEPRTADTARLRSVPMAQVAPTSPLVTAIGELARGVCA